MEATLSSKMKPLCEVPIFTKMSEEKKIIAETSEQRTKPKISISSFFDIFFEGLMLINDLRKKESQKNQPSLQKFTKMSEEKKIHCGDVRTED